MALFTPEYGLIFWMLVIFLIILGILAKYAWPVIIRSIEQRAEFIDNGVKYAQEARQQLDDANAKIQEMLADAHRKQLESLQETEQMKRGLIEEAKKKASVEVQKMVDEANVSIGQARREAESQVRRQVSRMSLDIAGKLLRKNLSGDAAQAELVGQMLDELEAKSS